VRPLACPSAQHRPNVRDRVQAVVHAYQSEIVDAESG
jgi:hypothetical protein